MNKARLLIPAVLLAFPLFAPPLAGQTTQAISDHARWHISLYAGTTSTGPAADLEQAFIREGYNETSDCLYVGCTGRTYPYSVTGWGQAGLPFTFEVRYRILSIADLGLLLGRTPIGETVGYRYPSEVDMQYGVALVAPMARFSFPLPLPTTPRFSIGGGPAWFDAYWTPVRDKVALHTGHEKTVGMLGRAGFEIPVDNNVLIGINFQYRSVGTITVGPVALPTAVNRHDLPPMPADFNHWYASFGFSLGL